MIHQDPAEIDKLRLDEEWENQPPRMRRACRKLAKMRFEHAKAKQILEVTKAEADKKIRANPSKYGITRISEKAIDNAVILHPKVQAAVALVNKARYDADIVEADVTALHHRKSAIEGEQFLFGMGYYAEPRDKKVAKRLEASDMGIRRTKNKGSTK